MDHSDDSFASYLHYPLMKTVKQMQKISDNDTNQKIGDALWINLCNEEMNSKCYNPALYSESFLSGFLTYAASNTSDDSFITSMQRILVITVKHIQKIGQNPTYPELEIVYGING